MLFWEELFNQDTILHTCKTILSIAQQDLSLEEVHDRHWNHPKLNKLNCGYVWVVPI